MCALANPDLPGLRDVAIPAKYREHPLLNEGSPYLTLPAPLLVLLVNRIGQQNIDDELLGMEFALSEVCGDHCSRIGFWRGQPINYQYLRATDLEPEGDIQQALEGWGKSQAEAQTTLASLSERRNWAVAALRGYCGWLMTNPTFLEEHCQLLKAWETELVQDGIPHMGPVVRDASLIGDAQPAEGQTKKYVQDFEEFFIRWRLDGMPAPFVPQPIGVHLPVLHLRPVLGHLRHGGTTFYIPDICPVPSRDMLRDTLEDALRDTSPSEQVKEWFDIVRAKNPAKNEISRYARIFEVQHYMRALYARHRDRLNRKKSAVKTALAQYLQVNDDAITRDFQQIAKRLGSNWYQPSS